MNVFLLLTEPAAEAAGTSGELPLNSPTSPAIMVVGTPTLLFLRKASRPPPHAETKENITAFSSALAAADESAPDRLVERTNRGNKHLGDSDKLVYATSAVAQKERDSDMDGVCTLLEGAREELSAFRNGGGTENWRLAEARTRAEGSLALMERILERDKALKKNKKRA